MKTMIYLLSEILPQRYQRDGRMAGWRDGVMEDSQYSNTPVLQYSNTHETYSYH